LAIKYLDAKRIRGLSSDTKPTNVPEGTLFEETDTRYILWRIGSEWKYSPGQPSYSTASTDAVCAGGTNSPWTANAQTQSWNGTSWDSSMANLPNARQFIGGRGNKTDFIACGGDAGGTGSPSKDTYLWNGSTWASSSYPQMDESANIGFALGGNTSGAFANGGMNVVSGSGAQSVESQEFNGTSWASKADSSYGGQGTCGDGRPTDFIRTGGTSDQEYVETFNGTSWATAGNSFPTGLGTPYNYGGACASGKHNFLVQAKGDELDETQKFDGTSWTYAGALSDTVNYGGYGGDSGSAIVCGSAWNGADSQLYDGTAFTKTADLADGISASGVGGQGG